MSETLEQAETRLGGALGSRWGGPTIIKAGTGTARLGQVRKSWYDYGSLEEVICVPPGESTPGPEVWPGKTNPFEQAPTPPVGTGRVKCIDVSSNQGVTDLSGLIATHQPEHVIVKLYQEVEAPTFEDWSLPQIHSALANGCTAGGYLWLYAGIDVHKQVTDVLQSCTRYNITLPCLWIDCETYEGEGPTLEEILEACAWTEQQGMRVGIYTGDWYWRDILGIAPNQEGPWAKYPCWFASYNHVDDFNIHSQYWPDLMIVGHQYWSNPIDLSVMRESFTVPMS